MNVHSRSYPNLYKDSVSLMTVSAKVSAVPGIDAASVVMASASNVENLARAGLGDFAVHTNDLVVAVSGAFSGSTDSWNISGFGSFHGSSSSPPSCDKCHRLPSRE